MRKGGMTMNEQAENTRTLLIANMKRVIEVLESNTFNSHSQNFAEYERKMHEVRRDSIRFVGELKPWTRN